MVFLPTNSAKVGLLAARQMNHRQLNPADIHMHESHEQTDLFVPAGGASADAFSAFEQELKYVINPLNFNLHN